MPRKIKDRTNYIILTEALSNVLSPRPTAMTGRPWNKLIGQWDKIIRWKLKIKDHEGAKVNKLLQPKEKRFKWPAFLVQGGCGMIILCHKQDYLFWVTWQPHKLRISHCSVQISRDDWFLHTANKCFVTTYSHFSSMVQVSMSR